MSKSTAIAVGVVALLVVGTGGVAFGAATSPLAPEADAGSEEREPQEEGEQSENETAVTANETIEAMNAAENETNGTVIGARLSGEGDVDLEASTFVYEFDVLAENDTQLQVSVYAENGTVIGVESANESDGFLDDLFGDEEGPTEEARNLSDLRSAAEAVEMAVNETDPERANQTLTRLELDSQNDTLVYRLELFEGEGEPIEVVVSAEPDEDFVTTDPDAAESRG